MSFGRDDTASKSNELQIGCSWIPVTPAKPGSTEICTNWGETERLAPTNQVAQASPTGPGDYMQKTQCQRAPACYPSMNLNNAAGGCINWPEGMSINSRVYEENLIGFDSWLAGEEAANSHLFGKDSSTYNKFSVNDPQQWTNISFGNLLLAMGKNAAMENALTQNDFATSSTSSSCLHPQFGGSLEDRSMVSSTYFHPQPESSQLTMNSGDSFLQDPPTGTDMSSMPSRHFINLNTPPSTISDAVRKNTPYQFQPVTPEKINRNEYQQEYALKDSSTYKTPTGEKNEITRHGVMQDHEKGKMSHLDDNQLCEVTSTQLQENHKPDKGGMEEIDLDKIPQQKTRRKKHRPKVIIEGQKKNTPKSSAQKHNASKETARVKRKYVRRKGVTSPLGGGTNGADSDNKTPSSTGTSVGKRKYRRARGISKSEDTNKETTETVQTQAPRYTRRSCRRSLNFSTNDAVKHGISSNCPSPNCERELHSESFDAKDQPEATHSTQETGVIIEKKDMVTSHVCTRSMKKLRDDLLSRAEQHPQGSLPPTNKVMPKENYMLAYQTMCTRGKCQIVLSDVTHDKEANSVQVSMNLDGRSMPKSPSDHIGGGTFLTPEKQIRGLKRQNMDTAVEASLCSRNETGIMYNSLQAYLPVFNQDPDNGLAGLHFPVIYKKKRTEKVQSTVTSSMQITAHSNNGVTLERHTLRDSSKNLFTSTTNQGPYGAQSQVTNLLPTKDATYGTQNGRQVFEDLFALGPTQMIKKRRSKGPTRQRNLASLLDSCKQWPNSPDRAATISRTQHDIEFLNKPPICIGNLVADTRSTMATKKRSKRSMLNNSTVQSVNNHQNVAGISMGPPLALTWKSMSPVDSIIDKLNRLDLNAESEKYNAFVHHQNYNEENYALVPFQHSGAVVPFDQARRRKPRPKVDLDDETTRVWRLLLENINSEGIDGTNEENTKWWEEERRVFIGRADSFIARMHLVQGDRHFSPWKGSVVDSVVGVFLTQNVSDHLSSSAFMSLAARYPAKQTIHLADFNEERLGGEINELEICDLESDEAFGLPKEILEGNVRNPSINTSLSPVISNEDGKGTEDALSSETPEISSQKSVISPIEQATGKSEYCLLSTSEEEPANGVKPNWLTSSTSFVKPLHMTGTVLHGTYGEDNDKGKLDERQYEPSESSFCRVHSLGAQSTKLEFQKNSKISDSSCEKEFCTDEISELSSESASGTTFQNSTAISLGVEKFPSSRACLSSNEQIEINHKKVDNQRGQASAQNKMQGVSEKPAWQESLMDATGSSSNITNSKNSEHKEVNSNMHGLDNHPETKVNVPKLKGGRINKEKENPVDWDQLRKQAHLDGTKRERTHRTMDSVDWNAIRCADVNEIAQTIKERGMNNMLAERIKDFLNRIVRDHGSIDLEWLRDVPPDKAKEYLLSIRGLGLKSVECVRLLTLHHLAFPVDTNVGRIAVRLGWVPLQPLPESLQLHLLELYPVLESIQKYLWPRLCKLDQETLYELHYQMITFGKVFCTKSKPNCNACPMRGECRHFASAYASARLALPAPQDKSIVSATENGKVGRNPIKSMGTLQLPSPQTDERGPNYGLSSHLPIIEVPQTPEPIIEMPATPEPDYTAAECDIENAFSEDPDEIPTIHLNMAEFTRNLQTIIQQNTELQEGEMSKALVALTSEVASVPVPKLKNVSRLRTEHQVYELPDSHQLLEGMDKRQPDDPCPYLLAIWTPGETIDSIEPPEKRCNSQGHEKLCIDETCSTCNSIREAQSQTVRGTLLIPCRTAMRGSFPLNGTYFQVNEVFSDHESSLSPMDIPREWLWNLPRRTVYFGTSIPSIFKGLSTEGIQYCFWKGFVCVRGFDRKTRAPRPLIARLHFPVSKLAKGKGKVDQNID